MDTPEPRVIKPMISSPGSGLQHWANFTRQLSSPSTMTVSYTHLHGDDIKRLFNFKYPYEYISRFEEILQRKDETLAFYQSHPIDGTKS